MESSMSKEHVHVGDDELLLHAGGELCAAAGDAVRIHLDTCARCRNRLAELEGTLAEFGAAYRASAVPPAPAAGAVFRERLRGSSSGRPTRGWFPFAWPNLLGRYRFALFGGMALAAFVFVALRLEAPSSGPQTIAASRGRWEEPDLQLTPGVTVPVAENLLCGSGAARPVPAVPVSLKRRVFEAYGFTPPRPEDYEVDYLITPELGGATDIRNLWPEPYQDTVWNARVKDQLEDRLHRMVCRGEVDLATAQHDISTDWIAAYRKYFHVDQPIQNETSLDLRRGTQIFRPS
jgi:hypothetical protein